MNIDLKLWINRYSYAIPQEYLVLLILCALKHYDKISDAKYKGQISALRKGTLLKKRHNYHSDINNQWYNDEPMLYIFTDIFNSFSKMDYVPLKSYIETIMLYNGKGWNYSLNMFGSKVLLNLYNIWNPNDSINKFGDYISLYIPNAIAYEVDSSCYCGQCSCRNYNKFDKKVLNDWIHSMKKGNLSKITPTELHAY